MQKAWYERLKSEGFQDEEKLCGEEMVLKKFNQQVIECITSGNKEEYYIVLRQKVQEEAFDKSADEIIMSWHADGKMIREICAELERRGDGRCRVTVRYTIRKYVSRWGIRKFSPDKLRQKPRIR